MVCPLTAFSATAVTCKGTQPREKREKKGRKVKEKKKENETPTNKKGDSTLCTPIFMHPHQRQPARQEAAAVVLFPALA